MKTSLKCFCVLLFVTTHMMNAGFSQSRIVGLITDISGKPFPSANVILIQALDSAMVIGFYRSANLFGRAVMKPFGMINFGVQKKVNQQRNVFSFNITDVLNTAECKFYTLIPDQNLNTSFKGKFNQRTFKVTYTHQFGNQKLTGKRERKTASEEERGRVTQ